MGITIIEIVEENRLRFSMQFIIKIPAKNVMTFIAQNPSDPSIKFVIFMKYTQVIITTKIFTFNGKGNIFKFKKDIET